VKDAQHHNDTTMAQGIEDEMARILYSRAPSFLAQRNVVGTHSGADVFSI
jgi:hypothetical protein